MKKWFFLILSLFLLQNSLVEASLDFSVFKTRGFEGKAELEFNQPEDLILAPDCNLLVADTNNNRIQVLSQEGDFIRFIPPPKAKNEALKATATDNRPQSIINLQNNGFKRPVGLAFDSSGKLYTTLMNGDQINSKGFM